MDLIASREQPRLQLPTSASAPDLLAQLARSDDEEDEDANEEEVDEHRPRVSWRPEAYKTPLGGLATPDRTPSPAPLDSPPPANGAPVDVPYYQPSTPDEEPRVPYRRHASEPYGASPASYESEGHSDTEVSGRHDLVEPATPAPLSDERARSLGTLPFSLWDYLYQEAVVSEEDAAPGDADPRAERISNFLNVPVAIERLVAFGWVICFDAFLHTFTILPLRIGVAFALILERLPREIWSRLSGPRQRPSTAKRWLRVSHKVDLIKGLLLLCSSLVLRRVTDASQMYHSVRGQETLKLYVIFNVLEVSLSPPSRFTTPLRPRVPDRGPVVLFFWTGRARLPLLPSHSGSSQ